MHVCTNLVSCNHVATLCHRHVMLNPYWDGVSEKDQVTLHNACPALSRCEVSSNIFLGAMTHGGDQRPRSCWGILLNNLFGQSLNVGALRAKVFWGWSGTHLLSQIELRMILMITIIMVKASISVIIYLIIRTCLSDLPSSTSCSRKNHPSHPLIKAWSTSQDSSSSSGLSPPVVVYHHLKPMVQHPRGIPTRQPTEPTTGATTSPRGAVPGLRLLPQRPGLRQQLLDRHLPEEDEAPGGADQGRLVLVEPLVAWEVG